MKKPCLTRTMLEPFLTRQPVVKQTINGIKSIGIAEDIKFESGGQKIMSITIKYKWFTDIGANDSSKSNQINKHLREGEVRLFSNPMLVTTEQPHNALLCECDGEDKNFLKISLSIPDFERADFFFSERSGSST